PSLVAAAGLKCFGQVSQVTIPASGLNSVFTGSPLGFTVRVAATSLTSKVNLKKAFLIHDPGTGYEKVPFCSTGADSVGDCAVSIVQDSATGDIIWKLKGPSNGTMGGAG